jgi:serine/threonine-protein kinase
MPVALDGQRGNTVTDRPQRTLATSPESSQRTQQLPAQPRSEARKGKITILVTPWALVWLDGKPLDQTPVVLDDVPAGRHHLRLQNSLAKKDETITIVVNPDQPTTIQRTW